MLLEFSTIDYWLNHRGAWFVAMLIPLYAITPLHYWICKRVKHIVFFSLALVAILVCVSSLYMDVTNETISNVIENIRHVSVHLPAFYIGFMFASLAKEGKKISITWLVFVPLLLVLSMKLNNIGYWPGFLFLIFLPLLCWFIRRSGSFINKILDFFGKISLESYLFNTSIGFELIYIFNGIYESNLNYGCYLHYMAILIIGTYLAYLVNKMSKYI